MHSRKHAIVLGASMSGLMAARVLRDHFEQVTVLDRDGLPHDVQNRRGIPQGNHAHGLLCGGRSALEDLFPGIVPELTARGAIEGLIGQSLQFFSEGELLAPFESDLRLLFLSRPLLEGHVRQRVRRLPNVSIHDGYEVLDLVASSGVVRGVRVKLRDSSIPVQPLAADLVVDATGRGSRLGSWLEDMGFERAEEERVRIDLSYTSCTYRRRPGNANDVHGMAVALAPPNRRTGVALAQEGDRWIVTLVGYLGEETPATHADMLEFARGLPSPAIHELLSSAEPLTQPVRMRFPFSQRRRYERLERFPEGLLAIGDTLCSFNPSFGQGMSVAALQAQALQECLQRGDRALWQRLFRASAKLIDTPWTIAVGADLGFPEVEGKRTLLGGLLGRYLRQLRRGAVHDPELGAAFARVAQLVDEPAALLTPALALRTLRASLGAPSLAPQPRRRQSFAG